MADMSKTTADKLAYSRAIEEAYAVHGREVAEKFSARLFGKSKPRALTIEELFDLLAKRLHDDGDRLEETDVAHQTELGDDVQPREERKLREAELKACLVGASDIVRGAFGEAYSRAVGLEAPLAERTDLLIKQARTSARLLRETPPPEARRRSARGVKPEDEAALLDEAAAPVEAAVAAVKKEEIEAQKTLLAREEADAQWGVTFQCTGDLLAVIATAAGVPGVAERVKTNWRRRAGIADPNAGGGGAEEPKEGDIDPTGPGGPFLPDPK